MSMPLALAAPAAIAGLAYLNAKTGFSYDLQLLRTALYSTHAANNLESKKRCNLFYYLEEKANDKQSASLTYIAFRGRRWTFKQVYDTVLKYGTWLKVAFNVNSGDIVCVDFINSEKFIFIWFGLWSIGAKPALINYNLTGKALAHCIRVSTSRLIVVDPNIAGNVTDEVRTELPGVEFVVFDPNHEADAMTITAVRQPDSDRVVEKLKELAMLIYTSGTTGLPKPAVISWNKVISASIYISYLCKMKTSDVFYTCMPLYHSSAAILGSLPCLAAGSTFAIGQKFSTKTFWPEVRESGATYIQYIGETCRYLLSAPPQIGPSGENLDKQHKVKIAFGNGLRPDVWTKFKERFGIETILEFYSATESNGLGLNMSRNDFSKGAIGRSGTFISLIFGPPAIVEMDLETEAPRRNEKGFCIRVPQGEPGELLFALIAEEIDRKYQGYFNNPKATESKVIRNVFKKGDAYFRSGDLGRRDSEGRLYFVDRIGDTFRWKGENVSTNEVAEVFGNYPAVEEANVYGVALPNHDGRAGCVAIIFTEEPSDRVLSLLAEHVSRHLPRFAVPLFLRVTKNMDRTGTNKQQKHFLRTQGVDPAKRGADDLYWLKDGTYVKFGKKEWADLNGGKVKL